MWRKVPETVRTYYIPTGKAAVCQLNFSLSTQDTPKITRGSMSGKGLHGELMDALAKGGSTKKKSQKRLKS